MADNASENVKAVDLELFQNDINPRFDGDDEDVDSSANESEDEDMPDTEVRDLGLEIPRGEIQDEVLISTLGGPNQAHETATTSLREWSNADFSRLGCTAHALQLVLKDTIQKSGAALAISDYIGKLVTFFHKSSYWNSRLVKKTKLAILRPGTTRWNSTIFAMQRILQVQSI
jgi:hypothetical protein